MNKGGKAAYLTEIFFYLTEILSYLTEIFFYLTEILSYLTGITFKYDSSMGKSP